MRRKIKACFFLRHGRLVLLPQTASRLRFHTTSHPARFAFSLGASALPGSPLASSYSEGNMYGSSTSFPPPRRSQVTVQYPGFPAPYAHDLPLSSLGLSLAPPSTPPSPFRGVLVALLSRRLR